MIKLLETTYIHEYIPNFETFQEYYGISVYSLPPRIWYALRRCFQMMNNKHNPATKDIPIKIEVDLLVLSLSVVPKENDDDDDVATLSTILDW